MPLRSGSRIGVIGGPDGSLCTYFLLDLVRSLGARVIATRVTDLGRDGGRPQVRAAHEAFTYGWWGRLG